MLDLGEGDVMEELDEKLAGEVGLVARESFGGNKDGRGGNNENIQGEDPGCREKGETDWLGSRQGSVGRLVSWSGQEVWHVYGGGLEQR